MQGEDGERAVDVLDAHKVAGLELVGDLVVGVECVLDGAHVARCVEPGLGVVAERPNRVGLEFLGDGAVGDYDARGARELVRVTAELTQLECLTFGHSFAEGLGDEVSLLVGGLVVSMDAFPGEFLLVHAQIEAVSDAVQNVVDICLRD